VEDPPETIIDAVCARADVSHADIVAGGAGEGVLAAGSGGLAGAGATVGGIELRIAGTTIFDEA